MNELKKRINRINKSYFSFADLRKISRLNDASLRVTITRLIKAGEIKRLAQGYYCINEAGVDFEKAALEIYKPSYLSFEWALAYYNILSQKPYALTLATRKRAKRMDIGNIVASYHHLREDLFFGYVLKDGILLAEAEKAFLDLGYLFLNGYAKFDTGEMNLELLDRERTKKHLKKFGSKRLEKLMKNVLD